MAAQLTFANLHVRTDKTKAELFGCNKQTCMHGENQAQHVSRNTG